MSKEENKVTRDRLRQMRMGETRVFDTPDGAAYASAKSLAYAAGQVLQCAFEVKKISRGIIITKRSRPV